MDNLKGNLSTLTKLVSMPLAGIVIGYAVSKGFNLPISQEELSEIIFMIILCVIGFIDARNPHSLNWLRKIPTIEPETEEDLINEDYYEEI